jgi:hypothetical protein
VRKRLAVDAIVLRGELLGEQRDREPAPGEVGRREEGVEGSRDAVEPCRIVPEPSQRRGELCARFGRVEIGSQHAHCAPVELELAVRIAPRREQEEGAPPRRVQLVRVERKGARSQEGERRERLRLVRAAEGGLQLLEQRER